MATYTPPPRPTNPTIVEPTPQPSEREGFGHNEASRDSFQGFLDWVDGKSGAEQESLLSGLSRDQQWMYENRKRGTAPGIWTPGLQEPTSTTLPLENTPPPPGPPGGQTGPRPSFNDFGSFAQPFQGNAPKPYQIQSFGDTFQHEEFNERFKTNPFDKQFDFDYEDFVETPAFKHRMEQGNKAIDRASSLGGRFNSPRRLKELGRFNQGEASQEFDRQYGRAAGEFADERGQHYTNEGNRYRDFLGNQSAHWQEQQADYGDYQNRANVHYQGQQDQSQNYQTNLQDFMRQYNMHNQDQSSIWDRFASLAGLAPTASGQAQNAGSNYANSYGNILSGNAANLGQLYQNQGDVNSANPYIGSQFWGNTADNFRDFLRG